MIDNFLFPKKKARKVAQASVLANTSYPYLEKNPFRVLEKLRDPDPIEENLQAPAPPLKISTPLRKKPPKNKTLIRQDLLLPLRMLMQWNRRLTNLQIVNPRMTFP